VATFASWQWLLCGPSTRSGIIPFGWALGPVLASATRAGVRRDERGFVAPPARPRECHREQRWPDRRCAAANPASPLGPRSKRTLHVRSHG